MSRGVDQDKQTIDARKPRFSIQLAERQGATNVGEVRAVRKEPPWPITRDRRPEAVREMPVVQEMRWANQEKLPRIARVFRRFAAAIRP